MDRDWESSAGSAGEQFDRFFHALWGYPAFEWQRSLAARVMTSADPWPEVLALPTAAGKTACLDVAVFALAMHPERGRMPRRVFFAVDRRLIVDAAYSRAQKIAQKLYEALDGGDPTLRQVAERLMALGGEVPLMAYELRGGIYRSEAWARSPVQPTVVATTVDQLGSRLLFRAYGRRPYSFPIYAGLVANDSLVLLDEAHCAVPFMETLRAVGRYRTFAKEPLPPPFHAVVMSATPPAGFQDVFRDTSGQGDDREHPLGRRRWAAKPATLAVARSAGRLGVAEELAASARQLSQLGADGPISTVVFCNRVQTAREVAALLQKAHLDTVLLTGRMRPVDKGDVVDRDLASVASGARDGARKAPLFVVATQTLEVGADLDFDYLVTECASLDALQQRFGRLNRMGRPIASQAIVVLERDLKLDDPAGDPIYGTALARTWQWLRAHERPDQTVDMSVGGLAEQLSETENAAELFAPVRHAPVMLPAHIDLWAQTDPIPWPSPDPAVFLHGPEAGSPDVLVCWRADFERDEAGKIVPATLDALAWAPPAIAECLPVPIHVMRDFLSGANMEDDSGDLESVAPDELEDSAAKRHAARGRRESEESSLSVIRWRGRDDAQAIQDGGRLRPGDVLVLNAAANESKRSTVLGDLARRAGPPCLDWGDRANFETRGLPVMRLHPAVVGQLPPTPSRAALLTLAETGGRSFEDDPDGLVGDVRDALQAVSQDEIAPKWLRDLSVALLRENLEQCIDPHPLGVGLIVRGRHRVEAPTPFASLDTFTDEDYTSTSGSRVVTLGQHLDGVARRARKYAEQCGLPEPMVEAVAAAGGLHDLGKADPRFQNVLTGGGRWSWPELVAKSRGTPLSPKAYREALKQSGYPRGGRHELLSVRMLESAGPEEMPDTRELKDLVLYLVATHHGRGRPFAPVVEDTEPVEVLVPLAGAAVTVSSATGLEQLGSGVEERFWRLARRYGWWGLPWLEAILRLADHRQSEEEQAGSTRGKRGRGA